MGRVSDARERLIDAATDLVWQQSYAAVSVDAICERACVKKGSLYHFFASKSELAVAVLEAHWSRMRPELDRIFSPSTPPLERISNYFRFIIEGQRALKDKFGKVLGCPFGCVGSEVTSQDTAICAKVREVLSISPKYMESALRDAIAEKLIPPQDPASKARALFHLLEGVLLEARIQNSLELLDSLPRDALDFIGAPPSAVGTQ